MISMCLACVYFYHLWVSFFDLGAWSASSLSLLSFLSSSNPLTSLLFSPHILNYIHRISRWLETLMMRSIFRGSSLIQIPLGTPANVLVISSESTELMLL